MSSRSSGGERAEAGISTPVKGRTGTVFLVGLTPLISPAMMIKM